MPRDSLPRSEAPHAGMPALDASAGKVSWFEFAPARLFYTPVALYCGWLSLRHLGPTLLTGCNPALPYSGLVGESKTKVLANVQGAARDLISPYVQLMRWGGDGGVMRTMDDALAAMQAHGLAFPLVAKPDIGMRGAGVQLVADTEALRAYILTFPAGANFLLQALVDEEGEAGVFYVRHPDEEKGRIISLTLKYFPRVTGDGVATLRQLILRDARAGQVPQLYMDRHRARLDDVIPAGEQVRLAFAGNHCRGTIFRNGNDQITAAMTDAFDAIAKNMGEFYVGRFDVRFGDFRALQAGTGFRIIEINGAGGEATHIWDSRMSLMGAYRTLMAQFGHLYAIGAKNRRRGFAPTPLLTLMRAWLHEKKLHKQYPITH
ncbi:MAG: D-alanine--D-alanine ligase [Alphaproteobacteria bacterium]|nr:MAG: D-alanine--D-alanine ligase [Alphaproteobacteria bacterium]